MHFSRIVFGLALASASTALPSSSFTSKEQGKNGKATPFDQHQQQQQLENNGILSQDHQAKSSSPFHQASSQHTAGQAISGSSFNDQEHFQQKQDSSLNHLMTSSSQEQEQEIQQRSNGKINGAKTQQGQEISMEMTGDPEPTQSNSPYYKAVETSQRQAESTLDKENIPASMKKQVRDYFDSIKP